MNDRSSSSWSKPQQQQQQRRRRPTTRIHDQTNINNNSTTSENNNNNNNINTASIGAVGLDIDYDDKELHAKIQEYDKMKPNPVSLKEILEAPTKLSLQDANTFLREEYCVRCAERICMIQERLPNFQHIPELDLVYKIHIQSFHEMQNYDVGKSNNSDDFIPVVHNIVERGKDIIALMCIGMRSLIQHHEQQQEQNSNDDDNNNNNNSININEKYVNKFLNEFLLNRIGSNVLMSQYLSVLTNNNNNNNTSTGGGDGGHHNSIVDPNCQVIGICHDVARQIQRLCLEETGYRPNIRIVESSSLSSSSSSTYESLDQNNNNNFAFIPGALSYILQEILKNSAVATAKKRNREKNKMFKSNNRGHAPTMAIRNSGRNAATSLSSSSSTHPGGIIDDTISVVVCSDERRVMIYIGDRAGGIPFDVQGHVWSYLYTTKHKKQQNQEEEEEEEDDRETHNVKDDDGSGGTATELGGFGVGLPLSRLYANYLGGSIRIVSLPDYGTHAYVFLPRLPEKMIETVPDRNNTNENVGWWHEITKSNGEFIL